MYADWLVGYLPLSCSPSLSFVTLCVCVCVNLITLRNSHRCYLLWGEIYLGCFQLEELLYMNGLVNIVLSRRRNFGCHGHIFLVEQTRLISSGGLFDWPHFRHLQQFSANTSFFIINQHMRHAILVVLVIPLSLSPVRLLIPGISYPLVENPTNKTRKKVMEYYVMSIDMKGPLF